MGSIIHNLTQPTITSVEQAAEGTEDHAGQVAEQTGTALLEKLQAVLQAETDSLPHVLTAAGVTLKDVIDHLAVKAPALGFDPTKFRLVVTVDLEPKK